MISQSTKDRIQASLYKGEAGDFDNHFEARIKSIDESIPELNNRKNVLLTKIISDEELIDFFHEACLKLFDTCAYMKDILWEQETISSIPYPENTDQFIDRENLKKEDFSDFESIWFPIGYVELGTRKGPIFNKEYSDNTVYSFVKVVPLDPNNNNNNDNNNYQIVGSGKGIYPICIAYNSVPVGASNAASLRSQLQSLLNTSVSNLNQSLLDLSTALNGEYPALMQETQETIQQISIFDFDLSTNNANIQSFILEEYASYQTYFESFVDKLYICFNKIYSRFNGRQNEIEGIESAIEILNQEKTYLQQEMSLMSEIS